MDPQRTRHVPPQGFPDLDFLWRPCLRRTSLGRPTAGSWLGSDKTVHIVDEPRRRLLLNTDSGLRRRNCLVCSSRSSRSHSLPSWPLSTAPFLLGTPCPYADQNGRHRQHSFRDLHTTPPDRVIGETLLVRAGRRLGMIASSQLSPHMHWAAAVEHH